MIGTGSSPLTRGKHARYALVPVLLGLIPTHAGKTSDRAARSRQRGAHPHSRGENIRAQVSPNHGSGSSPLTRGKHPASAARRADPGLIPTHAGKTWRRGNADAPHRAHPHSRGENTAYMRADHPELGSSPLTRGKPDASARAGCLPGLIPTHAGKTPCGAPPYLVLGAHPHSRGENEKAGIPASLGSGSSPLTRGKPDRTAGTGQVVGLIPTHAGKTAGSPACLLRAAAHPHSRGENTEAILAPPCLNGSSPLTRGKLHGAPVKPLRFRLIPTHAGKTSEKACTTSVLAAHPHSRGENPEPASRVPLAAGSSPLTRGKLPILRGKFSSSGLIPTHAGKTRSS